LRRALVVFQFMISIAFIVATGIIETQVSFLRNHPLGFDNRQMLALPVAGNGRKMELKTAIGRMPGVLSTSLSSSTPGSDLLYALSHLENKKGELETGNLNLYLVDYDFIRQHRIPLIAGRDFSTAFATDSTKALVVNELTVKQLGYANAREAIGRRFNLFGREGWIIGVVKDFNYWSLKYANAPMGMLIDPDDTKFLMVRVNTADLPATMGAIEKVWKGMLPGQPWSYSFEDEVFNRNYKDDERFGRLFLIFSVLAILISCLGLLGLASYATLQRTREIGIRKVLGASVAGIVGLLSSEFLKLVVLALVIAGPLCWFFMNRWLADYAYRIVFPWWLLAAGGGLAIFIAFLTIGFQTVKAALANPVKALKTE
jgi:putative ABC transport system permease protein